MGRLLDLLYLVAYLSALPWLLYRLMTTGGWRAVALRMGKGLAPEPEPSIWLHASSVGEIALLKPLISRLEREYSDVPLVVSAYTATGIAAARAAYPRHRVIEFPLDFRWIVRRYVRALNPALVIIVESELWPNFIRTLRQEAIRVAVVNGKMSEKSFRLHARARLISRALRGIDLLAVQSEEYAARMRALGAVADRIAVTGNMKYDIALPELGAVERNDLRKRLAYEPGDVVIIAASLHVPEDEVVLRAFSRIAGEYPQAALILVPRYPENATRVAENVRAEGRTAALKMQIDAGRAAPPGRHGVLVVDTVGELADLYAAADIAFVGGSLFYRGSNKGGHNLMEPAIYAIPVLFGPYNFSFRETAADLQRARAGTEISDEEELASALCELLRDSATRSAMGCRARAVIAGGRGATDRTFALLRVLMSDEVGELASLQRPDIKRTMQ
jgi:3-deoxy-D-manno-octulosonic-acid transferase